MDQKRSIRLVLTIDCEKYVLEKRGLCLFLNDVPVSGELDSCGDTSTFVVNFAGHNCPNISTDTVLKKLIGAYFLCMLFGVVVETCETCHNLITIRGVEKKLPPTANDSKTFNFVGLIASPRP